MATLGYVSIGAGPFPRGRKLDGRNIFQQYIGSHDDLFAFVCFEQVFPMLNSGEHLARAATTTLIIRSKLTKKNSLSARGFPLSVRMRYAPLCRVVWRLEELTLLVELAYRVVIYPRYDSSNGTDSASPSNKWRNGIECHPCVCILLILLSAYFRVFLLQLATQTAKQIMSPIFESVSVCGKATRC